MSKEKPQQTKTKISDAPQFTPGKGIEKFEDWVEEAYAESYNRVCRTFPGLKKEIDRSLRVPQLGKHHAEGPTMRNHLKLIIRTLHNIIRGEFPVDLDEETQELLRSTVVVEGEDGQLSVNPELEEYVFFHDISKSDCLTIKFGDESSAAEITWDQWIEIQKNGQPYKYIDPETGVIEEITSFGYFHPSGGSNGMHGKHAVVNKLEGMGVSDRLLKGIAHHEVAFQFSTADAQKFIDHFIEKDYTDPRDQAFIITASFIDVASSLSPKGKPCVESFRKLVQSKKNYELIKEYEDREAKIKGNDLQALKNKNGVVTRKAIEKKIIRNRTYNIPEVKNRLEELVLAGTIEQSDMDFVLDVIENDKDQQILGRTLEAKFGPVRKILSKNEV